MSIRASTGKAAAFALAAAFLGGCGILYTGIEEPYAYRSASPIDVKATATDPIVSGQACNRSVLYLFSWGNGGYVPAVDAALKGDVNDVLYDVKADIKVHAYVLGLYTKTCTVVTGKVGKL